MSACGACLRRARLVELLAGRIGDGVRGPSERTRLLLALSDDELAQAVSPRTAGNILAHLSRGLSNHAIARRMGVTVSTVEKHAGMLFRKLALDSDVAGSAAGGLSGTWLCVWVATPASAARVARRIRTGPRPLGENLALTRVLRHTG